MWRSTSLRSARLQCDCAAVTAPLAPWPQPRLVITGLGDSIRHGQCGQRTANSVTHTDPWHFDLTTVLRRRSIASRLKCCLSLRNGQRTCTNTQGPQHSDRRRFAAHNPLVTVLAACTGCRDSEKIFPKETLRKAAQLGFGGVYVRVWTQRRATPVPRKLDPAVAAWMRERPSHAFACRAAVLHRAALCLSVASRTMLAGLVLAAWTPPSSSRRWRPAACRPRPTSPSTTCAAGPCGHCAPAANEARAFCPPAPWHVLGRGS